MSYQVTDSDGVTHNVFWNRNRTWCGTQLYTGVAPTEEPATCLGCIGYVDTHRRTISASQLPNMQQIPRRPR